MEPTHTEYPALRIIKFSKCYFLILKIDTFLIVSQNISIYNFSLNWTSSSKTEIQTHTVWILSQAQWPLQASSEPTDTVHRWCADLGKGGCTGLPGRVDVDVDVDVGSREREGQEQHRGWRHICTAQELRMVLTFLKVVGKKNRKQTSGRDQIQPPRPKPLTIWSFTEGSPRVEMWGWGKVSSTPYREHGTPTAHRKMAGSTVSCSNIYTVHL